MDPPVRSLPSYRTLDDSVRTIILFRQQVKEIVSFRGTSATRYRDPGSKIFGEGGCAAK